MRRALDRGSTGLSLVGPFGFAVYGGLHLIIAVIAWRLAGGQGAASDASPTGALAELRASPESALLLTVATAGLWLLVAWQANEAIRDPDGGGAFHRGFAVVQAAGFGTIAYSATGYVTGSTATVDADAQTRQVVATAFSLPGGRVAVGGAGLVVIALAGYFVWQGLSGRFRNALHPRHVRGLLRQAVAVAAHIGYPAKGIAYGIVGALLVYGALTRDVGGIGGMNEGLTTLLDRRYGQVLLRLVAAGFALFGVYCVFLVFRALPRALEGDPETPAGPSAGPVGDPSDGAPAGPPS